MRMKRVVLSALSVSLLVTGLTGCYVTRAGVGDQSVESLSNGPQVPPVEVSQADNLLIPLPVHGEAMRLVHSAADPAMTVTGSAMANSSGYQLVAACSVPTTEVVVAADTNVMVTLSQSPDGPSIIADEVVPCDGSTHAIDALPPNSDSPQLVLTFSGDIDQVADAYAILVPTQK